MFKIRKNTKKSICLSTVSTSSRVTVSELNVNFIYLDSGSVGRLNAFSAIPSSSTGLQFIIDSGCSHPLCNVKSAFQDLKPSKLPINVANGSVMFTAGIGSIGKFKDIFYVPDLTHNLLSVSYLNKLQYDVSFMSNGEVLLFHQSFRKPMIFGHLIQNDLFVTVPNALQLISSNQLESSNLSHQLSANLAPITSLLTKRSRHYFCNIWHQRLVHINDAYVDAMNRHKLYSGCEIPPTHEKDFCESCAMAKSTYVPFHRTLNSRHHNNLNPTSSDSRRSLSHTAKTQLRLWEIDNINLQPLQAFSCDIKGPLPKSQRNCQYCLIFTCIRSRYRFAYFMKAKSDTVDFTRSFIHQIRILKTNPEKIIFEDDSIRTDPPLSDLLNSFKILSIKSDNGGEFVSAQFENLLESNDINHATTTPHSPFQNGIAERSNRTIFEAAIAILHSSNSSVTLWPLAVRHVIYTLNRLPNHRLQLKSTPYSEVYKSIPNLSHLRSFGCNCYVRAPDTELLPLSLRGKKGKFVGYDGQSLSYLVLINGSIIKSHHVLFDEDMSNCYSSNNPTTLENDLNNLLQASTNPSTSSLSTSSIITSDLDSTEHVRSSEQPSESSNTILPDSQSSNPTFLSDATSTSTSGTFSSTRNHSVPPSELISTRTRKKLALADTLNVESSTYSPDSSISMSDGINALLSGKYWDSKFQFSPIIQALYADNAEEILNGPDGPFWLQAMIEEIKKLNSIGTWIVVNQLPPNAKPLQFKWVFKTKFDIFQNFIRKARLTIKGCGQRIGRDFEETFSPVVNMTSIRLVLSLATSEKMIIWQIDFTNAFPNAPIDEGINVFMHPPPQMNLPPGSFLRLLRSLYGLKQSSRNWNILLSKTLQDLGFTQLLSDSCLFVLNRPSSQSKIIVSVYVDDLLVASKFMDDIQWLISEFNKHFKTNAVPINKIVGFQCKYNSSEGIMTLDKNDYSFSIVKQYSALLTPIPFRNSPLDKNLKFSRADCPTTQEDKEYMRQFPFRNIIGALNYLAVSARPDISFSVNYLARFMDNPAYPHWLQLLNVLAYIRDHPLSSITYSASTFRHVIINDRLVPMRSNIPYVFVDADFASSDRDEGRSVTS